MSKKNKDKATPLNRKSALKIAMPVIIGLLGIAVISVVVAIASAPRTMPKISNGDEIYLRLNGYDVTYEKLYGITKYNYGISEIVSKVDKELLKNQQITDEDKLETIKLLVFSDVEYDDLTEEERTEKIDEYKERLIYSGIATEEQYNEYIVLQTKRYVYAKTAFPNWVKDNDFSAAQYLEAFNVMEEETYTKTTTALVLMFTSEAQAKSILKRFDVDLSLANSSKGWYFISANEKRLADLDDLDNQIAVAKAELEQLKKATPVDDDAVALKEEEIEKLNDERDAISNIAYLNRLEAELLFIKVYNYLYAYYQGGNVSSYFDAEGNLLPAYELLVLNKHYEIVTEPEEVNEDGEVVNEAYDYVKWLYDEEDINEYVMLKYTEAQATAIDTSLNTRLFSSLSAPEGDSIAGSYTYSLASGTNYRFLAYVYEKYEPESHNYDFDLEPGEVDEDDDTIVGPSQEIRDKVRDYLIDEKFDANYQSLMLVLLRQEHKLTIFDRFLDASYGASYKTLYETTLALTDYPEYKLSKKGHKTVVCEYTVDGNKIKITADDLFSNLRTKYGPIAVISLMSNHVVLNDEKYNEIYIPATHKVIDKDRLREVLGSFDYMNLYNGSLASVKEFKYAFENNSFESYGFPKSYGWDNFLKDYLQMESDEELAANLSITEMYKNFYPDTYNYEKIKEMIELRWNEYYSLSVTNIVISVDYNLDGKPDVFEVDDEKDQEYWTDEQIALAKQLTALLFEKAPYTGSTGLDTQLTEVVNEYKDADFGDATWGVYKLHGLVAKNESNNTWTSADNLVQEFIDVMKEFYNEIENVGLLGETLDAPQIMDKVFPTIYGFHQVAISGSGNRSVLDEEDFSLAKLLEFLTEENYEIFLDEENEMTDEEKSIMNTYYVAAITDLEKDAFIDYYLANYRDKQLSDGTWQFTDSNDYAVYQLIQAEILKEIVKAYDNARGLDTSN